MKVVADGVQEAGGRLCGVSVGFLAAKARQGADEMVIVCPSVIPEKHSRRPLSSRVR